MTVIKPGTRLRSQVCQTEVVIVRAPAEPLSLTCGGKELVSVDTPVQATGPVPGHEGGNQLGKRYTTGSGGSLEMLVTRAGAGTLAADDVPLVLKEARPLPASD
ncbi:hypothetical protein [Pseudonocardia sp. N23]|uniref:hypothetical protein n=1 Tax=Pseudonocardia sp. N23 TaxID=1987376 RepID=UPI000C027BF3|nr:hypothetical protein [Pseudonocardia sp. N23]GAY10869.1 hypothetical protein TOK_5353 [Pseudonocardia sp. N23]